MEKVEKKLINMSLLTKLKPAIVYMQDGKITVISSFKHNRILHKKKRIIIPLFDHVSVLEQERIEIPLNVLVISREDVATKFNGNLLVKVDSRRHKLDSAIKFCGNKTANDISEFARERSEYILANYFSKKRLLEIVYVYNKASIYLENALNDFFADKGLIVCSLELKLLEYEIK